MVKLTIGVFFVKNLNWGIEDQYGDFGDRKGPVPGFPALIISKTILRKDKVLLHPTITDK